MARFCYSALFTFSLLFATAGCGGPENTVVEETRSPAEIEQQMKDYDKQMQESASATTNS